jgi:DNA polymerase-3 subunit gamma/tau
MSKYVVSALKYRPRRFDDVVGQPHIVRTLKNAVLTNQLAHAFLFCGPRGIGKTTCARILARVINCENLQNGTDPCGSCAMCTAFDKQASFNIFELDAASHNSVDAMRNLTEQVRYQPQHGRFKVYIIDEAHMLTTAAFNAFLKTLEEPPPYAIFILATTEKHKILPTVLSRCQIFDFRRITVKDMVAHLEQIAEREGVKAEKDALVTIAQKSDGALRDALSLFDRLASAAEKHLTYQSVIQNLNLLDYDMYFRMTDACLREDVRDVLLIYDQIVMGGFEGDTFLDGLATHYRDLLVSRDPATLALQDHSAELNERYQKQASMMSAAYIFSALNLINECDVSYPQVRNKRLHVEIALARICFLRRLHQGNPFGAEKKTPDGTVIPETSQSQSERPAITANPPVIPVLPKKTKGSNGAAPVETAEPPKQAALIKSAPATQAMKEVTMTPEAPAASGKVVLTPQLGSLFDLKSQIEKTEKIAKENSLQLTEQNAISWWNDFRQSLNSPSVATAFKQAVVGLEGRILKICVDSILARTRIQEESELLLNFRKTFHDQSLEIEIVVEETEAAREARKPKRTLTVREKYEILLSRNPAMENLKNKLGLIVDHDG